MADACPNCGVWLGNEPLPNDSAWEKLRAEVERLRAALRYIERPTMALGDQDPEQHVLVADERTVRLALQTCIRMALEALAVEASRG